MSLRVSAFFALLRSFVVSRRHPSQLALFRSTERLPVIVAVLLCGAASGFAQQITSVSVPQYSAALAVDSTTGIAYSLNSDGSVSAIDPVKNTITTTCPQASGLQFGVSTYSNLTLNALATDGRNNAVYVLGVDTATSPDAGVVGYSTATSTSCVATGVVDLNAGQDYTALLAVDSARHLVYAVSDRGASNLPATLVIIDTSQYPALSSKSVSVGTGSPALTSILVDPASGKVFLGGQGLYVYDPANNTVTTVQSSVFASVASLFLVPKSSGSTSQVLGLVPGNTGFNYATTVAMLIDFSAITGGGTYNLDNANPALIKGTPAAGYNNIPGAVGGAYSPKTGLLYVDINLNTTTSQLRSYNPFNPSSPNETTVADTSGAGYSSTGSNVVENDANGQFFIDIVDQQYAYTNPGQPGYRLTAVNLFPGTPSATRIDGTLLQDPGAEVTSFATNLQNGKTYIGTNDKKIFILTPAASTTVTPTLTLSAAMKGTVGAAVSGTISFTSTSTIAPTGNITVSLLAPGSTTRTTLGTYSAAQATAQGGVPFTFTPTQPGTYSVSATYAGDSTFAAAAANSVSVTVTAAAVTPTLTVTAPATGTVGTAVNGSLTFNFNSTTHQPTGNIALTYLAPGSTTPTTIANYVATSSSPINYSFTPQQAGTYVISASYAGDANFTAAQSNTAQVVVASATIAPTLALTVPSTGKAGTALSGTVKLTSSSTTAPTGTVNIVATPAGGSAATVATVTAAAAFAAGGASFSFTPAFAGVYTVTATYAGDTNYSAATTPAAQITVSAGLLPSALTLTGATTGFVGAPSTYRVQFTGSNQTPFPTGNITLSATSGSNTVVLGSVSMSGAIASPIYIGNTYPTTPGTYTVTASYPGDANYGPATSNSIVTVVSATAYTTSLAITAPPTATTTGAITVGVKMTTTAPPGTTPPAGNNVINVTATLNGASTPIGSASISTALTSGGATLTYTFPLPGTYTVQATYVGDPSDGYSGATSNAITVVVTQPAGTGNDYTMVAFDTVTQAFEVGSVADSTGTYTNQLNNSVGDRIQVTLQSRNGYADTMALSITDLYGNTSASITDASGATISSIALPANGSATFSVTIHQGGTAELLKGPLSRSAGGVMLACLLGCFGLGRQRRKLAVHLLGVFAIVAVLCLSAAGCGYGNSTILVKPGNSSEPTLGVTLHYSTN